MDSQLDVCISSIQDREETLRFKDLPIGMRFITAYGHNGYVKTSDTDAARLFGLPNVLYTAAYHAEERVRRFSEGHAYRNTLMDLTTQKLAPLASVTKGTLLGHVTVDDTAADYHETYEVAAWYRIHKLVAGTYPVYSGGLGLYGVLVYCTEIPTVITDACLVSLFGGVACGNDDASKREIGKADSYRDGNGMYASDDRRTPFEGRLGFTFTPLKSA